MNSESEDDESLMDEECEELCRRFREVTGSDTALALFYLQEKDWDLQKSVNAFFREHPGSTPKKPPKQKPNPDEGDGCSKSEETVSRSVKEHADPSQIRLLSWNIDGLDSENHKSRTTAVCETINREKPDIVFLQEVIPQTVAMLQSMCNAYIVITAAEESYFTAVMLREGNTVVEEFDVLPFHTSTMRRSLLLVKCVVKGVEMQLMTSHLESMKSHGGERKRQLTVAFQKMTSSDEDRTVVFGGDLNLRDKELREVGGIPAGVVDLWEMTGRRLETKFTWDTQKNDNLGIKGKFQPQFRFDRLYLRHCKPSPRIKPLYFELVGLERLPCLRFPSDHWGLLTHFDINGVERPK